MGRGANFNSWISKSDSRYIWKVIEECSIDKTTFFEWPCVSWEIQSQSLLAILTLTKGESRLQTLSKIFGDIADCSDPHSSWIICTEWLGVSIPKSERVSLLSKTETPLRILSSHHFQVWSNPIDFLVWKVYVDYSDKKVQHCFIYIHN